MLGVSELWKVVMECHIIFILPLPQVQIENCVFFLCKPKILSAALLILADLTYAPIFSAVPLRCNTPKTLQKLPVKYVVSKVLILIFV